MKKLLLLISISILSTPIWSQLQKSEHWIFVWDVTLSMCGYTTHAPEGSPLFRESGTRFCKSVKGNPNARYDQHYDIYETVVNLLTERIMQIDEDELGKITVLPFNDGVIEVFTVPATTSGKAEICKYIKSFDKLEVTNTNIYRPLKAAMDKAAESKNMRNIIMLLTDGEHNSHKNSTNELYDALDKFCQFAEPNDAFLFYTMLTKTARDSNLLPHLEGCNKRKRSVYLGDSLVLPVNVSISGTPLYNIQKDGESSQLSVDITIKGILPAGCKFVPNCEYDEYIYVDDTPQEEKNGKLILNVGLREGVTIRDVEQNFPKNDAQKLSITFTTEPQNDQVEFLNDQCVLEVINKPEKKMIIRID